MTTHFPSFAEFFSRCHGTVDDPHQAYVWQQRLADQVATHGWPGRVEVPTGLGKTSCVDIAVYELARQVHYGSPRTAPQRIFHVIERRTVVDQVHAHIRRLVEAIESKAELSPVREALAQLTGSGDGQVVVAGTAVHGGRRDDRTWLRATGCTIVALTAHQFVSRVLFRGFGVSEGIRSIHAGLCGVDRLVLFDEPHLALPAVDALTDAARLQARAEETLGVPAGAIVLLGATQPELRVDAAPGGVADAEFRFDPAAETGAQARRRIAAARPLTLRPITARTDAAYATAMQRAVAAARTRGAQRIVVVANTVALAQLVYRALVTGKNAAIPAHPVLLTGRFRPLDRAVVEPVGPVVLVATQTVEVGMDVSFDALITEACPYDALVQRLGRLNRDGGSSDPHAVCVYTETDDGPRGRTATDVVYGAGPTAALLAGLCAAPTGDDGAVDVSLAGLDALADGALADRDGLAAARPRSATLHTGFVPILTQTRPTPHPDVDPAVFLQGPDTTGLGEVLVTWRSDLDVLTDCEPVATESVSVPHHQLLTLLAGGRTDPGLNDAGATTAPKRTPQIDTAVYARVRVRIDGEWRSATRADLRPGAWIVLDTALGGYSADTGWDLEASGPVDDYSGRAVLADWSTDGVRRSRRFPVSAATLAGLSPDDPPTPAEVELLDELISAARLGQDVEGEPVTATDLMDPTARFLRGWLPAGARIVASATGAGAIMLAAERADGHAEGERAGSGTYQRRADRVVSLADHLDQVRRWARIDAQTAGLHADLAGQIARAGLLHDSGKVWGPFQTYLGNEATPGTGDGDPVAKPVGPDGAQPDRGLLPRGWRHEALSVDLAAADGASALTSHLVGSHHGWYRPLLPPTGGPQRPRGARDAATFTGLNTRFGPWGLAYLEAVLRLADWKASAAPEDEVSEVGRTKARAAYTRIVTERESADTGPPVTGLTGLVGQPLTGWFAAMGLLAAAQEAGDARADLHWAPMVENGEPVVPTLRSSIPIDELVTHIWDSPQWRRTVELSARFAVSAPGVKNQKVGPASALRDLLIAAEEAEALLTLLLYGDAGSAEGDCVVMPIPQFANNSSYPGVALTAIATPPAETVAALFDVLAGYAPEACDGGMDRLPNEDALGTGITVPHARISRGALAPLVLYGLTGLGAGPVGGYGVSGQRLRLPLPHCPADLAEMRALTSSVYGGQDWDWDRIGAEWILEFQRVKKGRAVIFWAGGPVRRTASESAMTDE